MTAEAGPDARSRKVGVFGGSFDPIHLGHLILAEQAREQFSLDEVLFLPAAVPPHKLNQRLASGKHRVEMIELAIAGNAAFRVDELELRRSGVSYTADTLAELRKREPQTEWFLFLGSDNLADLPRWYEPRRIIESARICIARRPGSDELNWSVLEGTFTAAECARIAADVIESPRVDISSTAIRGRVAQGKSIRYLVPAAVEAYIAHHRLYR